MHANRLIFALCSATLLIVAGVVRLLAARGDFWLDEIVSWLIVSRQASLWSILTEFRQETNHVLASWGMLLCGREASPLQHRLPAVIAGTLAVGVAGWMGARRSRLEAMLAMLLIGGSYLLVHYSSEARGYAYVMLFSLLSLLVLERAVERAGIRWDWMFPFIAIAGFLAQLTYLSCYVALGIWSLWHLVRCKCPFQLVARKLLVWHALPLGFLVWFYCVNVRHMTSASGPLVGIADVIVETLSLGQGGPAVGAAAWVVVSGAVIAFLAGLILLRREGSDLWLFYVLVVVIVPALLLLALRRQEVYPRYFIVSTTFLLLLESHLLARLLRQGRLGKTAGVLLLGAFLIGNGIQINRLIQIGRGDYREWLTFIENETDGRLVTLASDHDQRHLVVLAYARARGTTDKEMVYYRRGEWPAEGPQWLLAHSVLRDPALPEEITTPTGLRYRLVAQFPFAGLSGWHEAVYRRVTDPPPPR